MDKPGTAKATSGSRHNSRSRRSATTLVWVASIVAIACSDGATSPSLHHPPPPGSIQVLELTTYDGSGQAVHPDAVIIPAGWGGLSASNLVVTPYPGGQASFENPSVFIGQSAIGWEWEIPQGVQNPIARPTSGGYLSDPDELYNPSTNELWLYYRQVTSQNEILLTRSSDGVHWGAPITVVSVPNHEAISPTVVRMSEQDWRLWTVNSGVNGCSAPSTTVELRTSTDGIHWASPQTVSLGDQGDFPWHLDVTWVPEQNQFWALYNAKVSGSCTTGVLRFAVSQDGIHWTTTPTPLLSRGVIPEFADIVYRASLQYNAASDAVTIWYSGARYSQSSYEWHIAVQQMSRATMLVKVTQTPLAIGPELDNVPGTLAPPPLTNATAP